MQNCLLFLSKIIESIIKALIVRQKNIRLKRILYYLESSILLILFFVIGLVISRSYTLEPFFV
jgi:hypothetical protein